MLDLPRGDEARGRGLHEAPGDACAIAGGKEVANARLKVAAEVEARGLELGLDAVEQRMPRCDARCNLVQGIDHLEDIDHVTVR